MFNLRKILAFAPVAVMVVVLVVTIVTGEIPPVCG